MLTAAVFTQRVPTRRSLNNPNTALAATSNLDADNTSAESDSTKASSKPFGHPNPRLSSTKTPPAQTQGNTVTHNSAVIQPPDSPEIKPTIQVNEQFSGDSLDSNLWEAMAYPKAYRNNEEQDYSPGQVKVTDGHLQITANRDASGQWHSGEIHSKWAYTYGEFEVRLALSNTGKGVWPAAWLMGTTDNWPDNGEIDIFENINGTPTVYGTIHGGNGSTWGWYIQRSYSSVDVTKYHTYKVVKQPNYMSWSVDGVKRGEWFSSQIPSNGTWPFETHKNFGLLDLAIGGNWPGPSNASTPSNIVMSVDYFTVKNATN